MTNSDIVHALATGRKVRVAMPATDTLEDGRKLIRSLQKQCGFHLVYVQRIGCEPMVLVWQFRTHQEAMEGYGVHAHQC